MNRVPNWVDRAVFYQVYPQSFFDSNGDGIGDLKGVSAKLHYIKQLGCNAIWLNPCFESPFQDAGYDISDYCKVARRYGTNNDLSRLFKEARQFGIKIVLDLVFGHTSTQHPWFKKSCQAEKNKYTNWFIWTNSIWQGQDSTRMIRGYAPRNGNYYTNFFHFQPALNFGFNNPQPDQPWQLPVNHPDVKAVKSEMLNVMRYWLEMGADGFRVDMAFSLIKNDPDGIANGKLWRQVRKIIKKDFPESVLIAEWHHGKSAIRAGFDIAFVLPWGQPSCAPLFRKESYRNILESDDGDSFFNENGKGNVCDFIDSFVAHHRAINGKGFLSLISGNHDICRLNYNRTFAELECAFAMLLTMPVVPFIYYGDEIGMRYIPSLPSKEGGYMRTGARTPMQWDKSKNSGFSTANQNDLYLPLDPDRNRPDVESQTRQKDSLLNRVRKLIRIRQQNAALLASGKFEPVFCKPGKYPFAYVRSRQRHSVLVIINPRSEESVFEPENLRINSILLQRNTQLSVKSKSTHINLGPMSYIIAQVDNLK